MARPSSPTTGSRSRWATSATSSGRQARAAYDLVLLDVDNGPGYLVHEANAELYGSALLTLVRDALRPGGLCVIWSATRDEPLQHALREVFGNVETAAYDVDLQGRAEQYWLHLARVPSIA